MPSGGHRSGNHTYSSGVLGHRPAGENSVADAPWRRAVRRRRVV